MAIDYRITLAVCRDVMQQEVSQNIGHLFGQVQSKTTAPDYGSDERHNARLCGGYHAHKGAGEEFLRQWKSRLSWRDRVWVQFYEQRGEWGHWDFVLPSAPAGMIQFGAMTVGQSGWYFVPVVESILNQISEDLSRPYEEMKAAFGRWIATVPYSAVEGASHCRQMALSNKPLPWEEGYDEKSMDSPSTEDALRQLADNLNTAFASIGVSFVEAGQNIVNGMASGLHVDPEEFLIMVERINLRHNLERILIPSSVAYWLAERWPVWALPAVAWVRLQNQMAHEGGILLKWCGWLGGRND